MVGENLAGCRRDLGYLFLAEVADGAFWFGLSDIIVRQEHEILSQWPRNIQAKTPLPIQKLALYFKTGRLEQIGDTFESVFV